MTSEAVRPFKPVNGGKRPCGRDVSVDVQFRNGTFSKQANPARHWRWTDTGHDYDVIAARRA